MIKEILRDWFFVHIGTKSIHQYVASNLVTGVIIPEMMLLQDAFAHWRKIEDLEVLERSEMNDVYGKNTLQVSRVIQGALRPTNALEVQKIVAIANECHVPLYTISTGNNWGYGSSLPATDNCIILDLSKMRAIRECNKELGYVTLEPGVTQAQLYEYLARNKIDLMVPTTGAGPSCSIIGNALERGYGLTPIMDHFGAVTRLVAVLANGELYQSSLRSFGGFRVDPIYKWKIGPYLDGLFVQSNMGIVVEATILLARKPETVNQCIVFIKQKDLQKAIRSVATITDRLGPIVGVNIMDKRRLLAMVELKKEWQINGVIPEKHLQELAKRRMIPDWAILIGIYAPPRMLGSIKKSIRSEFSRYTWKILFLGRTQLRLGKIVLAMLPFTSNLKRTLKTMEHSLDILGGMPSEVALPLAYMKNPHTMPTTGMNPDRDGSGLIWYTPLLPMDGALIEEFAQGVREIFISEGLEPLITLTAISARCFDASIPIVFNREDPEQCERARSCHKRLVKFGQSKGVFPYRLDVETMRELYDSAEGPHFNFLETIKDAVDPNHILSPGRYSRVFKR